MQYVQKNERVFVVRYGENTGIYLCNIPKDDLVFEMRSAKRYVNDCKY